MDTLPIELIRNIATVDIYTYHALITAYPRFARDVPASPTIGKKDRFDYMVDFGFDINVRVYRGDRYIGWTRYGIVHMNGVPAKMYEDGFLGWFKYGKLHRDRDQPAVIYGNGDRKWYRDGKLHRGGDKPAIIRANGDLEWYRHGNCHRDRDQPAVIRVNGFRAWYYRGRVHRDGAPAAIRADGTVEWFNHGVKCYNTLIN